MFLTRASLKSSGSAYYMSTSATIISIDYRNCGLTAEPPQLRGLSTATAVALEKAATAVALESAATAVALQKPRIVSCLSGVSSALGKAATAVALESAATAVALQKSWIVAVTALAVAFAAAVRNCGLLTLLTLAAAQQVVKIGDQIRTVSTRT